MSFLNSFFIDFQLYHQGMLPQFSVYLLELNEYRNTTVIIIIINRLLKHSSTSLLRIQKEMTSKLANVKTFTLHVILIRRKGLILLTGKSGTPEFSRELVQL